MVTLQTDLLPRGMRSALEMALSDTPVVCVLGPRQIGKTTLVQELAPDRAYISLDDAAFASTARLDPTGFINGLPDVVTLDEVQLVPELLPAIKLAVDRDRRPGRFLLTGSANLLLLPTITESLAGRLEIIRLHPLSEAEKERQPGHFVRDLLAGSVEPEVRPVDPTSGDTLVSRLLAGGYPEACRRPAERARVWHRNYLKTIMEKDVAQVAQIRDVVDLARTLELLAQQGGSLLNVSQLATALSLSRATVDHYLAVLERLFLIRLLPAWHRNHSKRLVKSPKVHLTDSGMAATLMNLHADDWHMHRERFGHLLESFVVQQLAAQAAWTDQSLKLLHYRDKEKREVDCVLSRGSQIWGVEVKASQSVSAHDARGLRRLAEQAGEGFQSGIIFYGGSSTLRLGDDQFYAVPLAKLWEI
jgi:predicted AAA+ superfamily ATPase